MPATESAIDEILAEHLRSAVLLPPWEERARIKKRIAYHGIAPLLAHMGMQDWPDEIVDWVMAEARTWTMWSLRHEALLKRVTKEFEALEVPFLLLKGTALAYDLYPRPHLRPRGDTDLLVAPRQLARARESLRAASFVPAKDDRRANDELDRQQSWLLVAADGVAHEIDLHWQVMSSPALGKVLSVSNCFDNARALPALGGHCRTLDRPRLMLHACLHRAGHATAPYFVGAETYYGANRLIWAFDIHLLARSFSSYEWNDLCRLEEENGVAPVLRDGLEFAQLTMGTPIPAFVMEHLRQQPRSGNTAIHLMYSGPLRRNWSNLLAIAGTGRKIAYLRARVFPSGQTMRQKYPRMTRWPLPLLHLRRLSGLFRGRAGGARD